LKSRVTHPCFFNKKRFAKIKGGSRVKRHVSLCRDGADEDNASARRF
jgi:hypothetical protein